MKSIKPISLLIIITILISCQSTHENGVRILKPYTHDSNQTWVKDTKCKDYITILFLKDFNHIYYNGDNSIVIYDSSKCENVYYQYPGQEYFTDNNNFNLFKLKLINLENKIDVIDTNKSINFVMIVNITVGENIIKHLYLGNKIQIDEYIKFIDIFKSKIFIPKDKYLHE